MRRSLIGLLAVVAVFLLPRSAFAAQVLVLGHDGHVVRRDDRFLSPTAVTPAPSTTVPAGGRVPVAARGGGGGLPTGGGSPSPKPKPKPKPGPGGGKKKKPQVTVGSVLATLRSSGAITAQQDSATLGAFNSAIAVERKLSGTRHAELAAITENVHSLAAHGELNASRLPAVTATLNANRKWWSTGSLLGSGARVEFAGSQLVWEYYPGQGIQLQVLGTFGKADGLYSAGASQYPAMEQLLSQMIPLASQRGGGLAWEYYFEFDGGSPPWASAMAQATGLEALTRAYEATKNPYYLQVAAKAMPIFTHAPPQGVQVPASHGIRFLQYTFAPSLSIINAFLQTLIGLDDYATASGNPVAKSLFARGNAEAEWEVPHYDTGAWSLYSPGQEDTLSYHELVTGFLQGMCQRTGAPVYCTTAEHFTTYLKTPPVLADLTPKVKPNHAFDLRFRLSKVSRVGVTIARGSHVVFATSGSFPYGIGKVAVGKLGRGSYTVTLTGTDLAGNFARTPATLTVG